MRTSPLGRARTHDVTNQPAAIGAYNAFLIDDALVAATEREGAGWARDSLARLGDAVGDPANVEHATLANRHGPELRRYDGAGRRVDIIDVHPSWHRIMSLAYGHGLGSDPWTAARPGAHVAKAAGSILFNELEGGCMCPVAITYGGVPMLRAQPDLSAIWEPLLVSRDYDGRDVPAGGKSFAFAAFAATEKQGGSDLRGNSTYARSAGSAGGPGREYVLTGHKWFVSAATADIIYVSAQTEAGPSMFLVPKWLPDGSRNGISFERLKTKMGNASNPSAEIELEDAHGWLIGEEGRGIKVLLSFMQFSRFEVALMPVGEMRLTLNHALHHARHRAAFGRTLADQPLMRNVLADLVVEYEASVALAMRVGRSFDEAAADQDARAFGRLAVAVAKYWHNKRCINFVQEAMEVLGGGGYIEDSVVPRFYREAPVNNIWEGSGNVICLDILRTLRSDARAIHATMVELELARGGDARLDRAVEKLKRLVVEQQPEESSARQVAGLLARTLQAALLVRHAPSFVADAYCGSRLGEDWSGLFGSLPPTTDFDALVARGSSGFATC